MLMFKTAFLMEKIKIILVRIMNISRSWNSLGGELLYALLTSQRILALCLHSRTSASSRSRI